MTLLQSISWDCSQAVGQGVIWRLSLKGICLHTNSCSVPSGLIDWTFSFSLTLGQSPPSVPCQGELFRGQIRIWQLTSWRCAREQNRENMQDWSHIPLITLFQKWCPIAPASYYALEMNQWVHSKFKRKRLYKSMNTN